MPCGVVQVIWLHACRSVYMVSCTSVQFMYVHVFITYATCICMLVHAKQCLYTSEYQIKLLKHFCVVMYDKTSTGLS